jgi:sentrin-specific protease 1
LQWLEDEALAKGKTFKRDEWKLDNKLDIPRQQDGFNCGMFVILYIETLVKDSFVDSSSFSSNDVSTYRLKLAKAILRGTLIN